MKPLTSKKIVAAMSMIACIASANTAQALDTSAVGRYIDSIVSKSRFAELGASTAVISVKYDGIRIEEAFVSGAGETGLAIELHKSINWKKFPMAGESKATYFVASDAKGHFEITGK